MVGHSQLRSIPCAVASYGDRFKELRERLELKQPDVAERLFNDRTRQASISQIERTAGRLPHPDTIKRHARALKCQISDLVKSVDDLWIDRARRGEFDTTEKETEATGSAEARRGFQRAPGGTRDRVGSAKGARSATRR